VVCTESSAKGAYEDFDGEPDLLADAVDLTTIHKAKGLEWAAVFVPSLTTSRFPSSRTGRPRDWLVPRHLFSPERYEGSDAALQLAIYADAGLREGLPIEAAYVHDLKAADRQPVDVSPPPSRPASRPSKPR